MKELDEMIDILKAILSADCLDGAESTKALGVMIDILKDILRGIAEINQRLENYEGGRFNVTST